MDREKLLQEARADWEEGRNEDGEALVPARDFLSPVELWFALLAPRTVPMLVSPHFASGRVSCACSVPSSGLVLSRKAMKPHPKHGSSSHLLWPPA